MAKSIPCVTNIVSRSISTPFHCDCLKFTHGGLLGALLCCVYSKKAIGNHCFNEHHLVKSEFDIRISEKYGILLPLIYLVDSFKILIQVTNHLCHPGVTSELLMLNLGSFRDL